MWNGPGPGLGPRGGPPFRGDHRGEMFGRDRSMPDFRGRGGMNMGPMRPMGPMGSRPHDLPPMAMRRMDGPPMRGRDMDPRDMRNREPNRDFFRPGDEPDFNHRRQYDTNMRDKLMNSNSFSGPGRNMADMGGRGQPREPNSRFMGNRDRESLHVNMPQFHNEPGMDGRRFGFPLDGGDRKDFGNMHDRPPMGMDEPDRFNMEMPPRENRMMDVDRRGGPPFTQRGAFDSDTDFRNRHGPSPEFSRRDRSPLRFGNRDASIDRERSDPTSNFAGPQKSEYIGTNNSLREIDFEDSAASPLSDYRSGEEMSLAEEWKNRQKEKKAFLNTGSNMGGPAEPNFSVGFGRDINVRDVPFQKNEKPSLEFPGKEVGFPHTDHFPARNLPPVGGEGPSLGPLDKENGKKRWLGEGNMQHGPNSFSLDGRAPYHKDKSQPLLETPMLADRLKDMPHSHGPARVKMGPHDDFESTTQVKDQDYRDIDYRTGGGRTFDYHHDVLQPPEKLIKESKPIAPTRFSDSGPQDQDYRSGLVEDNASKTISIIGIPKTATMEQILGAFADPSGVPMQGMKIKNVVPGYSYDTAYVEFLNLEDAVRFMESNKGSLKVGTRTTSMKYIQADDCGRGFHEADQKVPLLPEPLLPPLDEHKPKNNSNGSEPKGSVDPLSHSQWQRSSDLTPEAWQQQVDLQLKQQQSEQQDELWGAHGHQQHSSHRPEALFKDSKTMILKNVKATTSVEAILKALDPFAYLDERNVRLVKAKPPGAKCFCFVDMDSHEQVTRLVELLTKPKPLFIDGVRVYAEVAKPLKNPNFRRDGDGPNSSMLGYPPEGIPMAPQQYPPHPHYLPPPVGGPEGLQDGSHPAVPPPSGIEQGVGYGEPPALDTLMHSGVTQVPIDPAVMSADASQPYVYGSEIPDMTSYLYDATSGFYYDPETTLYYDPSSRYFYNSQTQEYLYWDASSKTYIPVPAGTGIESQPAAMTAEDQAILSNPAADAPLELKKPSAVPQATDLPTPAVVAGGALEAVYAPTAASEKKEEDDASKKDKEEKPKSIAAVKIMKDMERWAKIQNRQKDSVRAASPVLKSGLDDERKQSKSADAGFAIFERKISGADDLFKKPLAPPKKEEKSKRPMGSLGLLASDYAAGSDEEVEEEKEEPTKSTKESQSDGKDSKLTDWKKMACLLCRRQFPNKDALIRHQQLSDLHKQNMEIHLKIKRSKKELEALENQEKELNARENPKSPEQKRRKQHHQQPQAHNSWAGSSRETQKVSERPGLGAVPVQPRKKKEHVVWTHATYKEAVRKAMFARFKELE